MKPAIVDYSKLKEHPEFRIDAECYRPYHLQIDQSIRKKGFKFIEDYSVSVINFGAYSLCNHIVFLDYGKPFLVTEDIKNNVIETANLHYISEKVHLLLHKSQCLKGQVLLTMAGAYLGQAAVFEESFECSSNQAIAKITLKRDAISAYYLSTFLNSKYGQSQIERFKTGTGQPNIERFKTGTGQPNLNLGLIKLIKVVSASVDFQSKIEQLLRKAISRRRKSITVYEEAQNILLSELGLTNWKPKHQLFFVRNFSETEKAERIDAEYYQPKYDAIIRAVKNYPGEWDTLGNLVSIKKCVEVGSQEYIDEGVPFIRVSNIRPFEITEEKYISEKLYHDLRQHQPKKGEILFSKDATPGIAYYLSSQPQKMIPSGGILRLKITAKNVSGEYLTMVLNSLLTKEQINRDVGGSVILHWRPDQVKETIIPILPQEIQEEIKQKVSESFILRRQSKHLLECAKRAVEIAIEQDEQTALAWLEKETQQTAC